MGPASKGRSRSIEFRAHVARPCRRRDLVGNIDGTNTQKTKTQPTTNPNNNNTCNHKVPPHEQDIWINFVFLTAFLSCKNSASFTSAKPRDQSKSIGCRVLRFVHGLTPQSDLFQGPHTNISFSLEFMKSIPCCLWPAPPYHSQYSREVQSSSGIFIGFSTMRFFSRPSTFSFAGQLHTFTAPNK